MRQVASTLLSTGLEPGNSNLYLPYCPVTRKTFLICPQILEVKIQLLHLSLKGDHCSPGLHHRASVPYCGAESGLKPSPSCPEQSLGQILEAAVSVGSRTLEVQLDALLVALHAQVGWKMSIWDSGSYGDGPFKVSCPMGAQGA